MHGFSLKKRGTIDINSVYTHEWLGGRASAPSIANLHSDRLDARTHRKGDACRETEKKSNKEKKGPARIF